MALPPDNPILAELNELRLQKRDIERRMRELARSLSITREPVHCQRCGFEWIPYDPINPPICCARCGASAWNKPPTPTSRKPEDPPAPSWRERKGRRKKWEPNPYSELEPKSPAQPRRTAVAAPAPAPSPSAPPPYIPPSVRAAIPPPPPAPPPVPAESLSERFSRIRDAQIMGEPQPETVASAVPRVVPAVISFPEVQDVEVETEVVPSDSLDELSVHDVRAEIDAAPAGDHAEPATVTSVEAPPEEPHDGEA